MQLLIRKRKLKKCLIAISTAATPEFAHHAAKDTQTNGQAQFFFKKYLRTPNLPLISILHTFGKDLKFNPHLHLIAATSISFKHKFNKLWKHEVLKQLNVPRTNKHSYGFYVWNSGAINKRILSKYIARYVRHPAIANGRIIFYDGKGITFFYLDANKNKIIVKKPVLGLACERNLCGL